MSLIASKVVDTIKTPWVDGTVNRQYSPDQLYFYAAIPAKHFITLGGGFRLANLIGAPIGSFYDWYCDLPPGEPMTWGEQTNSCESADWFNSKFIMLQGANLLETRIPDAHYFTGASILDREPRMRPMVPVILAAILVTGLGPAPAAGATKIKVIASLPDLKALSEAVGGDLVEVDALARTPEPPRHRGAS